MVDNGNIDIPELELEIGLLKKWKEDIEACKILRQENMQEEL